MIQRRRSLLALLLPAPLLPGCAAPQEMSFDAALFPSTPVPERRTPGRVAVRLASGVQESVHDHDRLPRMRMPVGRIVAEAMRNAADQAFAGGAERFGAAATVPAGFAATLLVRSARADYDNHMRWFLPVPFVGGPGDWEFEARLALEVTLLDAEGGPVWTRSYDDGRRVWEHEWSEQYKAADGLLRLTHEAAWRLSQRVVSDAREWVEAERMRPRSL